MKCVIALCVALQAAIPAQAPARVEQVAWLSGCWEYSTGQRIVEEQWMVPRGHTMLSAGRTTQGDRLAEYEMVLIREQGGHLDQ